MAKLFEQAVLVTYPKVGPAILRRVWKEVLKGDKTCEGLSCSI